MHTTDIYLIILLFVLFWVAFYRLAYKYEKEVGIWQKKELEGASRKLNARVR